MVGDSLVNMILQNKQQYTTESYIHLEHYLHITIHGQILLNQHITIFGKNKLYEKEYYKGEITMQEVKKATKALKGNQNIGPELNEK